ncbi:unnamed protein product, partial [Staurois parvus]
NSPINWCQSWEGNAEVPHHWVSVGRNSVPSLVLKRKATPSLVSVGGIVPIIGVSGRNSAHNIGVSGRNSAPSLVSRGGIVPHHWFC